MFRLIARPFVWAYRFLRFLLRFGRSKCYWHECLRPVAKYSIFCKECGEKAQAKHIIMTFPKESELRFDFTKTGLWKSQPEILRARYERDFNEAWEKGRRLYGSWRREVAVKPIDYGKRVEWKAEKSKFKSGQWLRLKDERPYSHMHGRLMQFGKIIDENIAVAKSFDGTWWIAAHHFELAMPRKGEYWQTTYCPSHGRECPPFKKVCHTGSIEREMVECGCLVPANFGKG